MIEKKLRFVLLSALLVSVAALSAPAFAQPPEAEGMSSRPGSSGHHRGSGGRHGAGGPPSARLERLVEKLDLDTATLESVYAVLDASRDRQRATRGKLREAHEQMRTLLANPDPDQSAALAQLDVIGALRTEKEKERLLTLLHVRDLLPADARDQLVELMQRKGHRGRHASRGGKGQR